MRLLLGCLAMLVALNAMGQIYRWTDEKGRVVYGNEPPSSTKASVVQDRINSYGGTPQVQRAPASPKPAAASPAGAVVMYATSWCKYCAQARSYFTRKGIAYVEHDVEKSAAANAEFKRLGGRGVPLIVYGGDTMRGFSEPSFEAFIARKPR